MSSMPTPQGSAPQTALHTDPSLQDPTGLPQVEARMRQLSVGSQFERAGAMVQEHLGSGGKRVRARLALAATEALHRPREDAIDWAAAVELLHNATLVHDDIQDGDMLRRGEPTLWVRHGMPQAINAGDLMLMLPTLALDDIEVSDATRWHLCRAAAARSAATVRGQSQEMDLLASQHFDWKSYLSAVEGKTGQLLALPVEGAALIAGRDPETARALGDAFVLVGVLFQLQDDTRDLFADKGRDKRGSDLSEGKVSALVVAHLEQHPEDVWLLDILEKPRQQTTDEDIDRAIEAFRDHGALEAVLARISELSTQLFTSPVLRSEPQLHQLALELADWITRRASTSTGAP